MVKKIVWFIAFIIVSIPLNIFCRFLYNQTWLGKYTFEDKLNLVDIVTLIISSGLTIWLGIYIAKKISEQRYQKEYIINDLKSIEEETGYIQKELINTPTVDITRLLDYTNRLHSSIDKFKKTLEIFETKCHPDNDLMVKFRTFYSHVTNISGSSLNLNNSVVAQINADCNDLILTTRKIIKEINSK